MMKRPGSVAATGSMVLWVLGIWMGVAPGVLADELRVPEDFATIQEAIDASADGDEVVIAPGTYIGQLSIVGKGLTLRSADPQDKAVLSAEGLHSWVLNIQESRVALGSLVVTRGDNAVIVSNSDLTCTDCEFFRNIEPHGSAMSINNDSSHELVLDRCRFAMNQAIGILIWDFNTTTEAHGCVFDLSQYGAGIDGGLSILVEDSRFIGTNRMGVYAVGGALNVTVRDTLFRWTDPDDIQHGIISARQSLLMERCVIDGWRMFNPIISMRDGDSLVMRDTVLVNNASINYPFILSSEGIDFVNLENCAFIGNTTAGAAIIDLSRVGQSVISGTGFCENSEPLIEGDWTDAGGNRFLDACCPADLSASSNPDSIFYGVPDLVVDSHDFFFYLDAFVNGDEVADIDGDGDRDGDDFFMYLELFVQGC